MNANGLQFLLSFRLGKWAWCVTVVACSLPLADRYVSGQSYRFAVVGETHGVNVIPDLITDMNSKNPDFVIFPGDMVNTGGLAVWNEWVNATDNFVNGTTNLYPVPGNHDIPGTFDTWRSVFNWLPQNGPAGEEGISYYFDSNDGTSRFIAITSDHDATAPGPSGRPTDASLDWLEDLLAQPDTQSKEHVFVYSHHPVTYDQESGTGGTSGRWWQTMSNGGVDAMFAGHWILYQPFLQPDPDSSMQEIVVGTGGGNLEGLPWQNRFGYMLVDVNGPRVDATFYGDSDGDGRYDNVLDQFVISDSTPPPTGLVAYYSFNFGNGNLDTAPGPLANQNHGEYVGNAQIVSGGILGKALSVGGEGDYAHGGSIRDYNMAINRDLTISLYANFDSLDSGTNANTLVAYSAQLGGYAHQEAWNHSYRLSLRDDKRLQLMWEYENGTDEVIVSAVPFDIDADEWHQFMVTRDAEAMEVIFYHDGVQVGDAMPFTRLPTGAANGTLHIGSGVNGIAGFDGLIDELTLYNEVLQPGQVYVGPLPGDLDGNGTVDLDDFTVNFLPNFGTIVGDPGDPATLALGDLDIDGDVDLFDFDAFQGAYLEANPGAPPLTIPEPAAGLLAAFCLLGWSMIRPRLKRGIQQTPGGDNRLWRGWVPVIAAAIWLANANPSSAAIVIHDYQFNGDLSDSNPNAGTPALVSGGGTLRTNGYDFGGGQGLSLSNWDPTALGEDYSIEFYVQFDVFGNGTWGKLVDYKDRGSDNGLYINNTNGPRLEFFDQGNPGPDTLTQGQFHHIVISRDEPGANDVNVWLDGTQQWTFDDGGGELAVANAANNILHFFSDDSGHEQPSGYVDFIRIYDGGVTQADIDAMVAGLPQYGTFEVNVNKTTGMINIVNDFPEPLVMRAYQLTSAGGELDTDGWASWDDAGLDGDTWFEANPSPTQLAELNLTATGTIQVGDSRTLGAGYGGGLGGMEDLVFEYLEPGNPTAIAIPVTYQDSPDFVVGDLNFDTNIDSSDWLLYIAGLGKDLSGMTMFDAFQMGDMDDDFDNDHADFVLFRAAYEQANGPGSFAVMLALPEPTNRTWLFTCALLATGRWARPKGSVSFRPRKG